MSLTEYHRKRDFKKTAEPKGKIASGNKHLFIIQKHAASHLHYDFRLELNGVLLSWAVPKGPCFDPTVKRLAMHVEDHPVEYGSFEGIIPKGEYGGGTVMLWDKGIWHPLDSDPAKAYQQGHLRFELEAHKLHGRWDLFRFKDDKHWFLVKHKDDYARPLADYDVTKAEPLSVLTEQTMDEIKANYQQVWTKDGATPKMPPKKGKQPRQKSVVPLPDDLKTAAFPKRISPQLATLVDKAPEGAEWLHEVKFDGYRILAFVENKQVTLKSRNHIDWTAEILSIATAIKKLAFKNVVFDGEVVLLDKDGKSDFQLLQNAIKANQSANFIYYIFDILYYDRYDLKRLPLIQRKEILRAVLPEKHPNLLYSDHIINGGDMLFHHSCELALEGIISKRINSPYETKRSKTWLKVKCVKRQEFVIGGYTNPQGNRDHFGSLYLGVWNDQDELEYVGNVGTGFTQESLEEIYQQLQQYSTSKNPFNITPPESRKAHWLKPVLVAEVEFTQWTDDNHLRHPSFKGLRLDKKAAGIKREKAKSLHDVEKKMKKSSVDFPITHPDKIIYPEDNYTKKDMLGYYDEVCDYILPFIQNRPLSLVRCPENYHECFFQRHYNATTPKALKSIDIESKGHIEPYIYLDNREGLLSLVQMGVLEIHPWGSLITSLETPDIIVIDLDPAPDVTWKTTVAAALDIKEELSQLKLTSFVKTTGGKGLHVVIPIKPEYDWDVIKNFTHVFVEYLEQKNPERYISKMAKAKRGGKIFVDYLRNQRSATSVSAYSSRSRKHAPVSVPLDWNELTNRRSDTAYTIKTLPKRLRALKNDPWGDFWKLKQVLPLKNI
ncbi:DNA ligase D [Legionella dresdenensis]|uniref:DNA ligase (ATP) n=1 Tax=Legionella dresdenensis TaxID=450200 RepID=A0ABV8CEH5_9GAMM